MSAAKYSWRLYRLNCVVANYIGLYERAVHACSVNDRRPIIYRARLRSTVLGDCLNLDTSIVRPSNSVKWHPCEWFDWHMWCRCPSGTRVSSPADDWSLLCFAWRNLTVISGPGDSCTLLCPWFVSRDRQTMRWTLQRLPSSERAVSITVSVDS